MSVVSDLRQAIRKIALLEDLLRQSPTDQLELRLLRSQLSQPKGRKLSKQ